MRESTRACRSCSAVARSPPGRQGGLSSWPAVNRIYRFCLTSSVRRHANPSSSVAARAFAWASDTLAHFSARTRAASIDVACGDASAENRCGNNEHAARNPTSRERPVQRRVMRRDGGGASFRLVVRQCPWMCITSCLAPRVATTAPTTWWSCAALIPERCTADSSSSRAGFPAGSFFGMAMARCTAAPSILVRLRCTNKLFRRSAPSASAKARLETRSNGFEQTPTWETQPSKPCCGRLLAR